MKREKGGRREGARGKKREGKGREEGRGRERRLKGAKRNDECRGGAGQKDGKRKEE